MHLTPSSKEGCAIIGISMLNSHFTQENIQTIAASLQHRYQKILFMLPDGPARHTLSGYGYNAQEAERTVNRKFKTLEKNCRTSIAALELPDADIVRWDSVNASERYQNMLRVLQDLYKTDPAFHADVRQTTQEVYENSKYPKKQELTLEEQTDAGITFFLEELAFIVSSSQIIGTKTEYVYHRQMPVLEKLLAGEYDFEPPTDVTFRQIAAE